MFKRGKVIPIGVAVLAAAILLSTQVISQEKQPVDAAAGTQEECAGDMGEMMAKWAEMNAKGPEHEKFKEMVGAWKIESKMWMMPEAPPTVSAGTAEFRLILDGRYIEQVYKCDMGGQGFEGRGIEGYDKLKKKYVSLWMDNMSTGMYMSEGTYDEKTKATTYYGKADDPFTGQKDKVVKSVAREITKDKVIFDMYDTAPDGTEFKSMEITYTRAK